MDNPRIYADFNNLDDENRLRLTCAGTQADLVRFGIQLQGGMTLTFYMDDADDDGRPDDILVEGVVHYNTQEKCWVAEAKWDALRNASDEAESVEKPRPIISLGL
jgi:hypothetical protein